MTRQTDPPPLDQHLDALGTQLDGAVQRAERRRSRVGSGLAAAAVVVAVGLGALVALPGGERLDPVDRARAALAEDGGILHWTVVTDFVGPNGRERSLAALKERGGTEVWAAASEPNRWRTAPWPADRPGFCGVGVLTDPELRRPVATIVGPSEMASSPGTISTYSPWSEKLVIQQVSAEDQNRGHDLVSRSPVITGFEPRDLVHAIRGALSRGQLLDRGVVERFGRRVRLLEGHSPQYLLRRDANRDSEVAAIRKANPDQLRYYVDATSFAPVELRVRRFSMWSRASGVKHWRWTTSIDHFLSFERLPTSDRSLLDIRPPAATEIVRLGARRDDSARHPERRLPKIMFQQDSREAVQRCEAARARKPTSP